MSDQVVETILQYTVDRGALNAATRDTSRLGQAVDEVGQTARAAAKSFTQLENAGSQASRDRANSVRQEIKVLRDRNALVEEARMQMRGFREEDRVQAMTAQSIGTFQRALGPMAMTGPTAMFSQAFQMADALPKLTFGIGQLVERSLQAGPATTKLVGAIAGIQNPAAASAAKMALVGGSMAAMGGAVVALYMAVKTGQKIIEDSKKATQGYMAVQQRYTEIITTGTTREVYAAIEANEQRNRVIANERDALQRLIKAAEDSSDPLLTVASGLRSLGIADLGGLGEVKDRVKELNTEYDRNVAVTNLLTGALKDGATAANDLRANLERAFPLFLKEREQEWNLARQSREMARTASLEEVQRKIDENRADQQTHVRAMAFYQEQIDQLKALQSMALSLGYAPADFLKQFGMAPEDMDTLQAGFRSHRDALAELELAEQEYLNVVKPAVQQREEVNRVVNILMDVTKKASGKVSELGGAVFKLAENASAASSQMQALQDSYMVENARMMLNYARNRAEQVSDFERGQAERLADFQRSRAEALEAHEERLDQIRSDRQVQREDAQRAYDKEEIKRIEEFNLRRRRAEEDYRDNILEAAASLDARAVWSATREYSRRKRQDEEDFQRQTEEKKRQFEEQQQQADEAAEERILSEKRAFEKQQRQAERAYRLQEQRAQENFQRQLARQDAEFRRQMQDRELQYTLARLQLAGFQSEEQRLRQAHYDQMLADLAAFTGSAKIGTGYVIGGGTGGTGGTGGGSGTPRYVMFQGQQVRVDQYDPAQAAGMTASQWYLAKLLNGWKQGGWTGDGSPNDISGVTHYREWVVPERGALVVFSDRLESLLKRLTDSPDERRNLAFGGAGRDIIINITESHDANRTAQAVRRELMAILTG